MSNDCKQPNKRWRRAVTIGALCMAAAFPALGLWWAFHAEKRTRPLPVVDVEPPVPFNDLGWAGRAAAEKAWARIGNTFPKFQIVGAPQDNSHNRVCIWDAANSILGGKHIPTIRQLIGDCVGAGHKHVLEYLQAIQIARDNPDDEWKPVYEPYHYAMGRNAPECGDGRIRGPSGSVGSWQAKAIELYGFIPADLPGLEPYSKSVISSWAVRMPRSKWVDIGKKHLVQTVAKVDTAAEVRDAICNGYPVAICSDWGGQMRPPVKGGRLLNKKSDRWMHCMCILAYDGTDEARDIGGGEPLYYILNSWGPNAHGYSDADPTKPPPGGFWVRERDVSYIVRQGDSFAFSDLQGFPAQDWVIIWKHHAARRGEHERNHHLAIAP